MSKKNTVVLFGTSVPKSCAIIPKYRRDEEQQEEILLDTKVVGMSRTRKGGRAERMKQDALRGRNSDTTHHAHIRRLDKRYENGQVAKSRKSFAEEFLREDARFGGQFLGYNAEGGTWFIHYYENKYDYFEGDSHVCRFEGRYMDALKKADCIMKKSAYYAWVPTHGQEVYSLYENEKGEIMRCYTASDFHEEPGKDNDYGIFPGKDWKDIESVITTSVKDVVKKAVTEYLGFSL